MLRGREKEMDFSAELLQLDGVLDVLSDKWPSQSDERDRKTRFIYRYYSYYFLIKNKEYIELSESMKQYALHRWYNRRASEICEDIFIRYGAERATFKQDTEEHTDIYINNVPFDVKVTAKREIEYDLSSIEGKNKMIQELYNEQSREQRLDYNNRLFVLCDNQRLKQAFYTIEEKISEYMEQLRDSGYAFNELEVVIKDKNGVVTSKSIVKADIIYIS